MKKIAIFCLVLYLIFASAQAIPGIEKIKVAVYNAEEIGGLSYGEKGIMLALREFEDFQPEYITDLSLSNLMNYDVLILPDVHYVGKQSKGWQSNIIKYVANGGGVLLTHDNVGFRHSTPESLFPAIVRGRNRSETRGIESVMDHPTTRGITSFETTYWDHITVTAGPDGIIVLKDADGKGVAALGTHGKGKVFATGLALGISPAAEELKLSGAELRVLKNAVRWLIAGPEWLEQWAGNIPVDASTDKYFYRQPESVVVTLQVWCIRPTGIIKVNAILTDQQEGELKRKAARISLKGATQIPGTKVYTKKQKLIFPTREVSDGVYKVICEITLPTREKVEITTLPFDFIGERVRTLGQKMEKLGKLIAKIKAKAKAEEDVLLAIRALDVVIRKENAGYLLETFSEKEELDAALSQAEEAEVVGKLLVADELPPKSSKYSIARLASDLEVETIWESSPRGDSRYGIGIYYAGVPLGYIDYRKYPTEEALNHRLQSWFEWDREHGYQIEERTIENYKAYTVTKEGKLEYLNLVKGNDLWSIKAPNEKTARKLANEPISLDGIAVADLTEIRDYIDPNPSVDAKNIDQILDFDYQSAAIVLGQNAEDMDLAIAERIKSALGGQIILEQDLNEQKLVVVVGTPTTSGLIKAYESDSVISYPHEDQGLLTFRILKDKEVVIVAGSNEEQVANAGSTLINLVTVLKEREMLVGDLHMHSIHSDGVSPPITVAKAAIRNYMDFASITDHNTPEGSLEAIRKVREAGIEYAIIKGQETTTRWAHLIVIGCADTISWVSPPEETITSVHKLGGLIIFAHPGRPTSKWAEDTLRDWVRSGIDAFEARAKTLEFYPEWKKLERLPSLVNSTDSHSTTFSKPVRTIVFAKDDQPESIIEAIRKGYCLGYTLQKVYGPDALIDVFNTLLEEGEYLKVEHLKRLADRIKSVY